MRLEIISVAANARSRACLDHDAFLAPSDSPHLLICQRFGQRVHHFPGSHARVIRSVRFMQFRRTMVPTLMLCTMRVLYFAGPKIMAKIRRKFFGVAARGRNNPL